MQANTAKDEVTINKAGTYRIGLTALMTTRDGKQLRTEVYKVWLANPTSQIKSIIQAIASKELSIGHTF